MELKPSQDSIDFIASERNREEHLEVLRGFLTDLEQFRLLEYPTDTDKNWVGILTHEESSLTLQAKIAYDRVTTTVETRFIDDEGNTDGPSDLVTWERMTGENTYDVICISDEFGLEENRIEIFDNSNFSQTAIDQIVEIHKKVVEPIILARTS